MKTAKTVCQEMGIVCRQMTTTVVNMQHCHRRNLGRFADRYQQLLNEYNRLLSEYERLIN